MLVLPLTGSCVVECDAARFELQGRASVFARVTDFAYVPRDARVRITSASGGEMALPAARARRRLPPAYGPAERVPIEIPAARAPASAEAPSCRCPDPAPADRLVAVELLTPAGNWSSYPPHKHDEEREGEAILEEIYYFRIARPEGFGFHRTYTKDGAIDATV